MPIALERVFALRTVRIFFKKLNRMKFISHLDMTRFMARLIKKSGIPVWYTEGFNQHIYLNFAVPLSLGFEGLYEILEIRIMSETFTDENCLNALRSVATPDIEFIDVASPVLPMSEIAFAEFKLCFGNNYSLLKPKLEEFLKRDSVICIKKGKKGKLKEIDIIPKIARTDFSEDCLTLTLNAGNEDNLNPSLVVSAFFEQTKTPPVFYSVVRTAVLDKSFNLFK